MRPRNGALERAAQTAVTFAAITTAVGIALPITLYQMLRTRLAVRARAEQAMRDMNSRLNQAVAVRTAELTELSRHLITVTEQEKAALARELHDALGSNLTAINMDLKWLQQHLPPGNPQAAARLRHALDVLAATVDLKRAVVEGLRPSALDTLGLGHAMKMHCEDFTQRTGVPCQADVLSDLQDLDPAWSIALYRIAQEALTNMMKYAQASKAHIRLERRHDGVLLVVGDDGVGLPDDATTRARAHGFVGMRERMRQLGGTLTVARGPGGRGTVVEAFIPFAENEKMVAGGNL